MKILLVVYDNDSYIHTFPHGIAYLAAVLLKEGIEVEIYNQDVHHWKEEHLTNHLDTHAYDSVGVSVIGGYYQYKKLLKISEAINRSKKRPFYIVGGHGPSPEPEYFLKKTMADAAVIGEGEVTIVELLSAVASHTSLKGVKGIAYRTGDTVVVNERRELIKDIDTIPMPAFHLFPIQYYRLLREPHCTNSDFIMPVLSGRGCLFKCNFCYRMDQGHRPRSNAAIIDEIRLLNKNYGINYIEFADELLMSSADRTVQICEDLIASELGIKWYCNGRLNFARKDVLAIMKRAGCVFINYGIEAFADRGRH
ncbi:MAG: cobalamin-dependent protein [Endomicrobiales bacterium]